MQPVDAPATDPADVPRAARLTTALLLFVFILQAGAAATLDSVTIDEFVGLPVGLYTLQNVDFRSESMNPPFFRSFAALPLLLEGPLAPQIPPMNEVNDWAMGYQFMHDYRTTYHQLFIPARCVVIFTSVILAALILEWARLLYGWSAGLVALFFFTMSPNMLASGHLVTLDVSGVLGWTSVAYLTWRFLGEPTLSRAIGLGLMLGLAPALKISGLVLPIIVAILFAIRAREDSRPRAWLHWLGLLTVVYAAAIFLLSGLYRFEGFGQRFAEIDFASTQLVHVRQMMPWLRLPLPRPFLMSLDTLFVGDQPTEPAYFFAGMWSLKGWWYYHIAAFLLKTPLPVLLPAFFAIGAWVMGRSKGVRDYCVLIPAIAVFVANSVLNPLNIGVRHALPALPLLTIALAPWLAAPLERFFSSWRTRSDIAPAVLSILLMAWLFLGTISIAPRYLEYFNELAGGAQGGHRWLIDSNIDWGQDLVRLSRYMRERNLPSVKLAYFGRVDPRVYGIDFEPVVEGSSHGMVVVSASFLVGRPYWIWFSPGNLQWAHHDAYTWLQSYEPVARVGSLFVFDVP